jgi:hypothetical protein
MSQDAVTVRLTQAQDYQFDVDFGAGIPALRCDEPPPLGQNQGPRPCTCWPPRWATACRTRCCSRCASSSRQPEPLHTEVTAEVGRNAENRLRVLGMRATLTLGVPAAALEHLDRVLASFEQYCTVTQSVAQGFPVEVQVFDATGARLK